MAWYRAGGGGIPASVKTDMNNVLNKKMGTTGQTYPPSEWADDVNLLGLLAEQSTVFAPVTTITNGADRVPIKAWEIDIPASLSGVSSLVCTQCGKNIVSPPTYSDSTITLCFDFGRDVTVDSLTMSFLATNAVALRVDGAVVDYRSEDGTHHYRSLSSFKDLNNNNFQAETTQNGIFFNIYPTVTFRYIYVYYTKTNYNRFQTDCLSNWQVEIGAVRTDYENYVIPISESTSLGRTIYGGSVDVVNGTGTDNCTRVKFSDLNWTYYTAGTNPIFYANNVPNMKTYARAEMPNIAIDGYTTRTAHSRSYLSTNMANMECSAIENAQTITFRNDTYTSKDAMLAALGDEYIVYEVSDSTSYTFSPMSTIPETVLGTTTLFADIGNGSVIYRTNGTVTPVLPTLITKSITENGTYSAEDDDADGYDEVTVNVPQGSTIPFEKVWSSGDTGEETFTCTEAGKYLFMVGTSARGTATITSSVTADFTSSKQGSDGRGLVIAVYTLAVGDTVTMTNTIVDWVYRVKAVFKTSLSVSTTVDSAIVTDGTLSSFSPTFTGNALFIYMAGGRADTNSYDRTYATGNFEWASKCETQTFIRLSYGSDTPTPSLYGYDGGCALAICLQ